MSKSQQSSKTGKITRQRVESLSVGSYLHEQLAAPGSFSIKGARIRSKQAGMSMFDAFDIWMLLEYAFD